MHTPAQSSTVVPTGNPPHPFAPLSRPPVILQVVPSLVTGGVERGTVDIAGAITAAGGVALVASSGGPMVRELERVGAEHLLLPVDSKNPLVMRRNVGRLATLIRDRSVDIVHARSRAPAWSAEAAARRAGAQFVTTFHAPYNARSWLKRRYNAVMARGVRVIAISEFVARHVREVYGTDPARIRVIHRGVDLERFDPAAVGPERVARLAERWTLSGTGPVVLLPGRLTRWKGQALLLQALGRLRRADIRCVLVGADQGRHAYRRELETLAGHLDLSERLRIVGECDDMPAAYCLADLVVSASTDPEGFGRVMAEAQALGRPVVASDQGAAREIVIEGETGWLFRTGDPTALAVAIDAALALDPAARDVLARRAMDNVRARFSKADMCAHTLALYAELIAGAPR